MNKEELFEEFYRITDEHKIVHEEFMACHFWQFRKSHRLFKRSNELMDEMWAVWDKLHAGPFYVNREA